MSAFLSNLDLIWDFLLDVFRVVCNLYVRSPIFMSVFSLWVLDRVFGIFDLIRG